MHLEHMLGAGHKLALLNPANHAEPLLLGPEMQYELVDGSPAGPTSLLAYFEVHLQ
jgi:hypothetical protein